MTTSWHDPLANSNIKGRGTLKETKLTFVVHERKEEESTLIP